MTSVAYPGRPEAPGWLHATLSLVVGWLASAAAVLVLYGAATLVGAISQPYAWHAGIVNEWPYPDNGLWGLLANLAVRSLALVLTVIATSWWLRRRHTHVSDGRLAVVLFFTGWIPLATAGPAGGLFGFLVALVLVRRWVARHEDRLAPAKAAAVLAVLGAVVLSYGLLHPLWTADVFQPASGKQRAVEIDIHNAARTGVSIERIDAGPPFRGPARPARLRLAPGARGTIALSLPRGGCGTGVFGVHIRYHVFGLTLGETLPARVQLGHDC